MYFIFLFNLINGMLLLHKVQIMHALDDIHLISTAFKKQLANSFVQQFAPLIEKQMSHLCLLLLNIHTFCTYFYKNIVKQEDAEMSCLFITIAFGALISPTQHHL